MFFFRNILIKIFFGTYFWQNYFFVAKSFFSLAFPPPLLTTPTQWRTYGPDGAMFIPFIVLDWFQNDAIFIAQGLQNCAICLNIIMCSVDVCRYLNKVLCCSIYSSCDEHRGAGRSCVEVTRPVLCCAVCAVTACCCSQNKMASKSFSILCNTTDPSSVVTHSSEYFGLDCETLGIKLKHLIKKTIIKFLII